MLIRGWSFVRLIRGFSTPAKCLLLVATTASVMCELLPYGNRQHFGDRVQRELRRSARFLALSSQELSDLQVLSQ